MNAQLVKELKPLAAPWAVAATAGVLSLAGFAPWGPMVLFGGAALLAALPFGLEFHHRTLGLLLSQPAPRSRVWNTKIMAALLAVSTLGLLQPEAFGFIGQLFGHQWADYRVPLHVVVLGAVFLVSTIASAGLWTMVARSVIGGVAFTLGMGIMIAAATSYGIYWATGVEVQLDDPVTQSVFAGTGLVYCVACLWLGWRKFVRMELNDVAFGEAGSALPSWLRWRTGFLRCRPKTPWLNLLRKEVMLQRPILTIAVILVASWAVVLGLMVLKPGNHLENLLILLAFLYLPAVLLLAGCISLGEEHHLGVVPGNLTLPVSARGQWFIKFVVGLVTAASLGILLPVALARIATSTLALVQTSGITEFDPPGVLLVLGGLPIFALGLWAVTFIPNTVRAALTAALAYGILLGVVGLANQLAAHFGGLLIAIIVEILVRLQWPPPEPIPAWMHLGTSGENGLCYGAAALTVVAVALGQSLRGFRRLGSLRFWKASGVLAAATFIAAFCGADYSVSLTRSSIRDVLEGELWQALHSIRLTKSTLPVDGARVLTVAELEATGGLSDRTIAWLRNSTIEVRRLQPNPAPRSLARGQRPGFSSAEDPDSGRTLRRFGFAPGMVTQTTDLEMPPSKHIPAELCRVTVRFPNGRVWSFASLLKVAQ